METWGSVLFVPIKLFPETASNLAWRRGGVATRGTSHAARCPATMIRLGNVAGVTIFERFGAVPPKKGKLDFAEPTTGTSSCCEDDNIWREDDNIMTTTDWQMNQKFLSPQQTSVILAILNDSSWQTESFRFGQFFSQTETRVSKFGAHNSRNRFPSSFVHFWGFWGL